jgi:hypothetical protein
MPKHYLPILLGQKSLLLFRGNQLNKHRLMAFNIITTSIFYWPNAPRTFFLEKFRKCSFSPKNGRIEKLMVPTDSAPQELSNEWSCQYASTVVNFFGTFCVPPERVKAFSKRAIFKGIVQLPRVFVTPCTLWTESTKCV